MYDLIELHKKIEQDIVKCNKIWKNIKNYELLLQMGSFKVWRGENWAYEDHIRHGKFQNPEGRGIADWLREGCIKNSVQYMVSMQTST